MKATFTYGVDLPDGLSDKEQEAIRTAGEATLAEHGTVFSVSQGSLDTNYTVIVAVKGKPGEQQPPIVVPAQSPEEAAQKAEAQAPEGTEYATAAVMPGDLKGRIVPAPEHGTPP